MNAKTIKDILIFLRRSKGLQSAERYQASLSDKRNTVADHSWRLALMVMLIGSECDLPIQMDRALSLALIHDLAEAETGDIDAYIKIKGGEVVEKEKATEEVAAMKNILDGISFDQTIYDLWNEYEAQETLEAKFVKALDRIEGVLHIAEDGVDSYQLKEFYSDYPDQAVQAFDNAAKDCPELSSLLAVIKNDLKEKFEKRGIAWLSDSNSTH